MRFKDEVKNIMKSIPIIVVSSRIKENHGIQNSWRI